MDKNIYDLIIVGAGPAGLTAGIYANRYRVKTLVIGQLVGGLMTESHKICNFPTEEDISGFDLSEKMRINAVNQGVEIKYGEVTGIGKETAGFRVKMSNGEEYASRTVLLATGTVHRTLGLPNEHGLLGHGISYCATCDGMFYRNKAVAVVGGGDSALTSALYLSDIAEKVYLIYRGQKLRGEPAWLEKINARPQVKVLLETNVTELLGESKLSGIRISQPFEGQDLIGVEGLFIEIGTEPKNSGDFPALGIETDELGYIKVNAGQATTGLGIWAAGDITTNSNSFRQIITACAEGAVAAEDIFRHFQSM